MVHFHCATHLCEETPEISPEQTSLSHTYSLYLYSRAQQLGLGQTFELNTGIKSFSQHKTPQFTGSTPSLTHQPHLQLPALILKPGGGGSSHLQGRCLCHPRLFFFCAGETAVQAKLRLRPGYNRFSVQITCNLHRQN